MMQRVHTPEKNSCCPSRQKESGMFAPRGFARRTEDNELDAVPQADPLFDSSFAAVPLFPPVQAKFTAARGGEEQEADGASSEEWFDEDDGAAEPVQAKPEPNRTGMPDRLKAGIESLSGIDMSDVRVHANSNKPARLNALAYTQGNQIYLGPGQERHLPHEAWHAVQQAQGRVRATVQMRGMGVNDEAMLEGEADGMGYMALREYMPAIARQEWKGQVEDRDRKKGIDPSSAADTLPVNRNRCTSGAHPLKTIQCTFDETMNIARNYWMETGKIQEDEKEHVPRYGENLYKLRNEERAKGFLLWIRTNWMANQENWAEFLRIIDFQRFGGGGVRATFPATVNAGPDVRVTSNKVDMSIEQKTSDSKIPSAIDTLIQDAHRQLGLARDTTGTTTTWRINMTIMNTDNPWPFTQEELRVYGDEWPEPFVITERAVRRTLRDPRGGGKAAGETQVRVDWPAFNKSVQFAI